MIQFSKSKKSKSKDTIGDDIELFDFKLSPSKPDSLVHQHGIIHSGAINSDLNLLNNLMLLEKDISGSNPSS